MAVIDPRLDMLSPAQRALWPSLKPAQEIGFVLYGGAAASLRLGHRPTVDFDLFNSQPLDKEALRQRMSLLKDGQTVQELPQDIKVEKSPSLSPRQAKEQKMANSLAQRAPRRVADVADPRAAYAVDALGRSLDPAAVRRAVDTDNSVSTLRDSMAVRMRGAYQNPEQAGQRLAELIAQAGHAEAGRRLQAQPDVLGALRGAAGTPERANAAEIAGNSLAANVTKLGAAMAGAETTYRNEVSAQLQFESNPQLSAKATAAVDSILAARRTTERGAAQRAMNRDPAVSREIETYMERAERVLARHKASGETSAEAARRLGRAAKQAGRGAAAVGEGVATAGEAVTTAALAVPGVNIPAAVLKAFTRVFRIVTVSAKAASMAEKITRPRSQGGGFHR
jgi:hypothetical protein